VRFDRCGEIISTPCCGSICHCAPAFTIHGTRSSGEGVIDPEDRDLFWHAESAARLSTRFGGGIKVVSNGEGSGYAVGN
jgi:hypothetical protein